MSGSGRTVFRVMDGVRATVERGMTTGTTTVAPGEAAW